MFIRLALRTALAAAVLMSIAAAQAATYVYVSNADSRKISVLSLDLSKGELSPVQTLPVTGVVMPLAVSPDRKYLYASLRSEPFTVASFRIDPASGKLSAIGSNPLPDSMANIATDRSGRHLFAASYGGHKMSVGRIGADGAAGPASQVFPTGQNAHFVLTDPANRNLFVTNLGADAVMQWRFDAASGELTPNATPTFAARPKAGPRHLAFHPNGRFVYLLNELDAAVDVLAFDAAKGTLSSLQTVSTLPAGFSGKPWAADLHLTPDGHFLYTSERTTSTLAAFAVDANTGQLKLLSHTDTEKQPRGFNIDPSGRYLVAAGQLSHSITLYRRPRQRRAAEPALDAAGQEPELDRDRQPALSRTCASPSSAPGWRLRLTVRPDPGSGQGTPDGAGQRWNDRSEFGLVARAKAAGWPTPLMPGAPSPGMSGAECPGGLIPRPSRKACHLNTRRCSPPARRAPFPCTWSSCRPRFRASS